MNTSDNRLVSTIDICRDGHAGTFDNACTYLSQQIASIYPQHQPNAFGKRVVEEGDHAQGRFQMLKHETENHTLME